LRKSDHWPWIDTWRAANILVVRSARGRANGRRRPRGMRIMAQDRARYRQLAATEAARG
jgi:hypothetical protein